MTRAKQDAESHKVGWGSQVLPRPVLQPPLRVRPGGRGHSHSAHSDGSLSP